MGVSRSGLRPFPLKNFHQKILFEKLKTVSPWGWGYRYGLRPPSELVFLRLPFPLQWPVLRDIFFKTWDICAAFLSYRRVKKNKGWVINALSQKVERNEKYWVSFSATQYPVTTGAHLPWAMIKKKKKAETKAQWILDPFYIPILGSCVKTSKHWGNLIFENSGF